ncbi:MAG: hypothetical protein A2663_02135 [Candidatus Buchananbacteria bacterium RIFCSPHIGHO2_01_FULL_46_12]|uniref:Uncharacterized protein n=2 Tax=Candidatus Buchananiibacteriota TaxID=1817903 RepID=A0A1G1Y6T7_9BACT|nr:MAG: hypothetical protein A2663_02135 [Candidatus Buchananbacteria bacterium RIFCSPHIGHO2_01_FULL_46_12]OGY57518.1 MAG: hypothetical protein A3H67_01850 [Candidatus Buchananbacteria bacterium RIFCSPLOWO2_02_FULL_46_11b]
MLEFGAIVGNLRFEERVKFVKGGRIMMMKLEQVIELMIMIIAKMTRKNVEDFGPGTVLRNIKGPDKKALDIDRMLRFLGMKKEVSDDPIVDATVQMFRQDVKAHVRKTTTIQELAIRLMGSLTHMEEGPAESSDHPETDTTESDTTEIAQPV